MMRDPYDPHGGQYDNTELPRAQDLDSRSIDEQRAHDIANCQLCSADGYRIAGGRAAGIRCDHIDHAPAAARGKAACLDALKKDKTS